jgi:hypothetical protein
MFKKKKRKKEHRYYRGKRRKKGSFWSKLASKFLWIMIIFLTGLLAVYAFSFYHKLSQPEAKEQRKPTLARVQILNGCSKPGGMDLAQKMAKRLEQLKVDNIVYEIVAVEKSELESMGLEDSEVKESMILDRMGNENNDSPSEVALLTAKALGVSPQNVIYKRLKNNYQEVSLTILIGNDYKILFTQPKGK